MAQISVQALEKRWDDFAALDGIDLEINDGEFVAILGPSGCGKSTTLFLLAGIYLPTSGAIRFDGDIVNEVEPRHRNVGIVFQSYALYPNMTVLENIMFPLRFQDVPKAEARQRAVEAARLVEIEQLLDRAPGQLSGGQQQRVALARALVKRPNLLLLDEPLSNLDATLRLTMRTEIRRIQREMGVTTVLVTHDQIEATTMADRVICMNAGKVEQIGTPEALYHRPDSLFVAKFIGTPPINLIEGRCLGGQFVAGDIRMDLTGAQEGAAMVLGLRPEALQPAKQGLAACVRVVEPMGREVLYTCETPMGVLRFLDNQPTARFALGANVTLGFAPETALFFDPQSQRRLPQISLRQRELA
ncbi:ABC transporter ATP-binding protein [Shimia sp. R11_0]|uniref:ABC transporter ATP-binding protein n=1 Tax=Shimia sp. R11_0 TaxID=2821096 RepID=UPI001ADC5278|nr:ABC transporter ATP-binding protein [Shimia sp. R11_0]MBO9477900.1 ABC transporter ATP-binding protein [Shimia sp. R11_0]